MSFLQGLRDLVGHTAAGRSVLKAASAAAQRLAIGLGAVDTDWGGFRITNLGAPQAGSDACTRTYADGLITSVYKGMGDLDCSANPNYPNATAAYQAWTISAAGKVGGASGLNVDIGDLVVAKSINAGGTQAAVGTSWFIVEHNLVGGLLSSNNLSDLASAATARTNLGLGTAAVSAATDFLPRAAEYSRKSAGAYSLVQGDAGKVVGVDGTTTIPVLTANTQVTVFNDSGSAITVNVDVAMTPKGGAASFSLPSYKAAAFLWVSGTEILIFKQ